MHLIPTNQTGENPGWESSEPYYQDIFTFWVRWSSKLTVLPSLRWLIVTGPFPLLYGVDASLAASFI